MKKILIFSLQYYPLVGGAEVAIKEITGRISSQEIEFHMITLRYHAESQAEERIGNVLVHRIGKGKKGITFSDSFAPRFYIYKVLFVPLAAMKGLMLQKKHSFDGVWAMMTYMLFPIVLMRICGSRLPYMLTVQEGDPFEHVFERWHIRLFSPMLFYGIRHAHAVQAISNFLGEWVRRCGYKGQIHVIPNGVNIAKFTQTYTDAQIDEMKEKLGKNPGDIFIVTTSRLVHKNGIDDVIRALPLLPENVSFLIYGIGPDEEMLRALAKELGVESRAWFMGQISHDEMPLMLKSCDIFTRPSRSEGMGNSFIEAMAAGLPVVATQEGGIADFLFDERRPIKNAAAGTEPSSEASSADAAHQPMTGWAVDADSPEQIAEAVKDILNRPEKVQEVTRTAANMVTEKYDWDLVAREMRELFESLLH